MSITFKNTHPEYVILIALSQ